MTETEERRSISPAAPPFFFKIFTLLSYSSATRIAMSDILKMKRFCFDFCFGCSEAIYKRVVWIRMEMKPTCDVVVAWLKVVCFHNTLFCGGWGTLFSFFYSFISSLWTPTEC
ncbi:hypothetical protein V8G54_003879 [Vigna mungo]|uniref:Uncharacterized protein n=1 Tax=Vigna mungo TaxID=3915 RepID=A0AAQ3PB84_VIGMU